METDCVKLPLWICPLPCIAPSKTCPRRTSMKLNGNTIWANDIQNVHVQAKLHFNKNKMEYLFYQIPCTKFMAKHWWNEKMSTWMEHRTWWIHRAFISMPLCHKTRVEWCGLCTCAAALTVGIRRVSLSSSGRIDAILEQPSTASSRTESCSSLARLLNSLTRSDLTNSSSMHFANS